MIKTHRPVTGMRAFTSHQRRVMRAEKLTQYGPHCQICVKAGKPDTLIDLDTKLEDRSFSFDHIVPLADGGRNVADNLWPTHIACNELKGSGKVAGRVRSNRQPREAYSGFSYSTSSKSY